VHQACGPAVTDSGSCYQCETASCCDTTAACIADPQCEGFKNCLVDCTNNVPDEAGVHDGGPPDNGLSLYQCDQYCLAAWPNGLVNWAPQYTCVSVYCLSQSCGAGPLDACQQCTYGKCLDAYANLQSTPGGYLLLDCYLDCKAGDTTCFQACDAAFPKAKPLETILYQCIAACPSCPGQ
jgi:hypothetical protein